MPFKCLQQGAPIVLDYGESAYPLWQLVFKNVLHYALYWRKNKRTRIYLQWSFLDSLLTIEDKSFGIVDERM